MKELYTRSEAAEMFGISVDKIDALVKNESLPFVKIGDRKRFRKVDLDAFIEARSSRNTTKGNEIGKG